MAICKRDGCDEDAVAVQLVRLEQPVKLADWCRPHHVEERRAAGVLDTVEVVTNRALIMGVDGSENRRGAVIELDSEEIDIDMLVQLGFVKLTVVSAEARLKAMQDESARLEAQLAEARAREAAAKDAVANATDAKPGEVVADKPAPSPKPAGSKG